MTDTTRYQIDPNQQDEESIHLVSTTSSNTVEPLIVPYNEIAYILVDPSKQSHTLARVRKDPESVSMIPLESLPSSELFKRFNDLIINFDDSNFSTSETLHIVINPQSGHKLARKYFDIVVQPLLEPFRKRVGNWKVWETRGIEDGERIGREIVESTTRETESKTVIVLGGDGTVHELLNGALLTQEGEIRNSKIDLVVLPCGTANALYFHLFPPESSLYPTETPLSPFYSLLSFLRRKSSSSQQSQPLPLSFALNTLTRSPSSQLTPVRPTLTSVVTSAALHACLLHDAEALRVTIPGLERFKIAAQENVKRWWNGTIRLRGSLIQKYDSIEKRFKDVKSQRDDQETEKVDVEGPFAYFVSSLVSRFEPDFIVAPLRSPQHLLAPTPSSPSIDIIVIRPLRHTPTRDKIRDAKAEEVREEARKGFGDQVWGVTGGMYGGGKHIDMLYQEGQGVDDNGGEREGGEGEGKAKTSIVEVFRCNEFEWIPDSTSSDLKSNLVCLDGALHDLGRGGKLSTKVVGRFDRRRNAEEGRSEDKERLSLVRVWS